MAGQSKNTAAGRKPAPTQAARKATGPSVGKPEIRIFVSYSHVDEAARVKLETHLAALKWDNVSTWFDGDLDAGDALDRDIARELRRAHIFVALLSPNYLASDYCWKKEFKRAMTRRSQGLVRVVAAVVRPCDWKATRAARFKLLPTDGRPVTQWRPADKAYLNIAEGIRGVVTTIRKEMAGKPEKNALAATSVKAGTKSAKKTPAKARNVKPATPPNTKAAKPAVRKPRPKTPRTRWI